MRHLKPKIAHPAVDAAQGDAQTEDGVMNPMQEYATQQDEFRHRAKQFIDRVEAELHDAVGYVDRVVVPEVRREAGSAARLLAGHLERLADRLQAADRKPGL